MRRITGLIGWEDLLGQMLREIRKGKHVFLTGPVGIGKSAILDASIRNIARRRSDRYQLDPLVEEAPLPDFEHGERRRTQGLILGYVAEYQAKRPVPHDCETAS